MAQEQKDTYLMMAHNAPWCYLCAKGTVEGLVYEVEISRAGPIVICSDCHVAICEAEAIEVKKDSGPKNKVVADT